MAYIHKHGDKWRAQVAKQGVRRTAVWDKKSEAQAWAARVEAEIAGGKIKASVQTLSDAIKRYQLKVSSGKRSPDWEKRRFGAMLAYFGDVKLSAITSDHIGEWRDKRLETVSGSTIQREANLLRHLFSVAKDEWRWIEDHPFRGVKLPAENAPRTSVWGWRQTRRVIRYLERGGEKSTQIAWAFHTALRTGMRLSEVLASSLSGNVATLPRSKTSSQPVKIPLTRHGIRMMKRQPAITVGPNEASALFSRACQSSMVHGLTFHDARATALTLLARKVDVLTLSRISQHRDISLLARVYYRETAEQISARMI